MNQHLFVYGTLRKDAGHSMFHLLAQHAHLVGKGRVPGLLYDLGNYPGAVLSKDHHGWIRGEVFALNGAGYVLARIDEYEGCGPMDTLPHNFKRTLYEIELENGERTLVWVYVYRGSIENKREIPSGNYLEEAF